MKAILGMALILLAKSALAEVGAESYDERMASSDLDALSTWESLDVWRKNYSPRYDDGFYFEGISDFVERRLSENWGSFPELVMLSSSSPELFDFVISHLGVITSCSGGKRIILAAQERCPLGQEEYCRRITSQCIRALARRLTKALN